MAFAYFVKNLLTAKIYLLDLSCLTLFHPCYQLFCIHFCVIHFYLTVASNRCVSVQRHCLCLCRPQASGMCLLPLQASGLGYIASRLMCNHFLSWVSGQVRYGNMRRSSTLLRPLSSGTQGASVWQSLRQKPGPSPSPWDTDQPAATTRHLVSTLATTTPSLRESGEQDQCQENEPHVQAAAADAHWLCR